MSTSSRGRSRRTVLRHSQLFPPKREGDSTNGFNILIKEGAVIERAQKDAIRASKAEGSLPGASHAERAKNWLCGEFFDVRAFGGVLSTGDDVMKGSAFGQVRGPVQFTFGQSLHPITPLEVTITRCAVTKEEDAKKERTMGNKHIVPYGLYAAKGYVSPAFAERTGFTNADLDLLFQALLQMFEHDRWAARGEMILRGLFDFEHVGTQHPNNAEQNKKEARLGCYHAHKLIEGIKVDLSAQAKAAGRSFPESFADYEVMCDWTEANLPKGVKLNLRHEGRSIGPNQG